jgi:putative oxidoreductase
MRSRRFSGCRGGPFGFIVRRLSFSRGLQTPHRRSAHGRKNVGFDAPSCQWTPQAQGLLRIVTGFLFMQHSTAKLFGFPHVPDFDNVHLISLVGFAGVIELVGAPLLLFGLFTRPVAFVLSGEMAFAYFIGHAPHGNFLFPSLNQGEPAVLYCFIFLFFAAAGPGAWSLDKIRNS